MIQPKLGANPISVVHDPKMARLASNATLCPCRSASRPMDTMVAPMPSRVTVASQTTLHSGDPRSERIDGSAGERTTISNASNRYATKGAEQSDTW